MKNPVTRENSWGYCQKYWGSPDKIFRAISNAVVVDTAKYDGAKSFLMQEDDGDFIIIEFGLYHDRGIIWIGVPGHNGSGLRKNHPKYNSWKERIGE